MPIPIRTLCRHSGHDWTALVNGLGICLPPGQTPSLSRFRQLASAFCRDQSITAYQLVLGRHLADGAVWTLIIIVLDKPINSPAGIDQREGRPRPDELDYAIRQIVSRAVASDKVIDIFSAAGLRKPDISILSDEFLAEVRGLPQRNLAVETLRKLLEDEIKTRGQKNIVQARSFAEMLENAIRRYQNRAIEAAAVIEELIALAREMRAADRRGDDLGLTEDEVAFYDALEVNDSAVKVLGDETLRMIAQELVGAVRNNVTIDWTLRENVRAKMRVMVKRILRRHGYPPDKQEKATRTVLEQAEVLCRDWAVG